MKLKRVLLAVSIFFGMSITACGGGGFPDLGDYTLQSIEITHQANRLDYSLNDQVDYTGLEVTAHYSKATADKVLRHSELSFSGFSSATAGEKTIKIEYTYKEVTKETSYKVTVFDSTDVTLDFYGFNDTHGNVKDSALGVGIAKTSTFIKNQTAGKNALLVSSGDMWQGSLESNSTRGALMTEWMEYLNFTSMTIGNHEFDWGVDAIKENAKKYSLPILGINIIDKTTNKRADYVTPSTIVYRGGAKIGIIGAIGNCYGSISYSKVMDVEFILDSPGNYPLSDLIKAESTRLRNEEKCDFIVYSFHGDSIRDDTYYNLELSTGHYVDVVFEGHKHVQTSYVDDGGVWHFQSQADGSLAINHFTVNLNTVTDQYTLNFNETSDVYYMNQPDKTSLADDAGTLALINKYDFSSYYTSLGRNSRVRGGNELRQLNADLYLEKGLAKWKSYANQIVLGGGYISVRGTGQLPIGDVTYAQLYTLFPFDNDIILMKVNGWLLKSNFINSTNSNYFLGYSTYGAGLRDDQSKINDESMYYVVTDSYTYDYLLKWNADKIAKVGVYDDKGYYARDCLADYAKAGKFDAGGSDLLPQVDIVHNGAFDNPYTVAEAYTICQLTSDTVWAYVKGTVTDKAFSLVSNYFQDVELKDDTLGDYKMNMYKLHRMDGDVDSDGNLAYGYSSTSELPAGSELLFYGGFYLYQGAPRFSGVNVAIAVNNQPASGLSMDNPTSIVNLWQALLLNYSGDLYFYGKVDEVIANETYITSLKLKGNHNVDFVTDYMSRYGTGVQISNDTGNDIAYASGIEMSDIQVGCTIICKYPADSDVIEIVGVEKVQTLVHAGTLEDPFSVSDALLSASWYPGDTADAANAPRTYITGVVSQKASRLGTSNDLGNVYIKDPETNKEIMIYFLSKYQGVTKEDNFTSVEDLQIGDEILINGQAFNYKGNTLQISYGAYCVSINGVPTAPAE